MGGSKGKPLPKKISDIGKVHPSRTMFLRQDVGSAEDPNTGIEYQLTTGMGSGCPIVQSGKTGKWFTISWTDIIGMAVVAGINDKD